MAGEMYTEGNVVQATHNHFRFLFAKKQEELVVAKKSKPGLIGYAPIFTVALFKDLLDLIGIGSLPGIGTVITFAFGLLIFLLLMLVRANKKLLDSRFLLRMGVILIFGTAAEGFLFGLNFLPIETITIAIIYLMDRHMSDAHIAQMIGFLQLLHKEEGTTMRRARQLQKQHDAEEQAVEVAESQAKADNEAQYQQAVANDAQSAGVSSRKFM